MRFIRKRTFGGHQLEQVNERPPTTPEEATNRWGSFTDKNRVSGFLCDEQYGLCAYSEIRSDLEDIGTHIEHIQPKRHYPHQTFDFSNLVLCALADRDLSDFITSHVFGGHAKLSKYDPELFVSCLQESCSHFFAYLSDGRVIPAETLDADEFARAEYTIKLLNLNSEYLKVLRKNWLNELDQLIDDHLSNNDSLEYLAVIYLLPISGRLDPFFSASRKRLGAIAEQLLTAQAPELL